MKNKIAIKVMKVGPAEAAKMLLHNFRNNRDIKLVRVNTYVKDMLANNWIQTGESIKFDLNGDLIDGQHRLTAIVKSGVTLELVVIEELPVRAMRQLDTEIPRRLADALTIESFENPKELAATLSSFASYEGYIEDKITMDSGTIHPGIGDRATHNRRPYRRFSSNMFPRSAAFQLLERRDDIVDTVALAKPLTRVRNTDEIAPPIGVAALLVNVAKYDDGTANAIEYIEATRIGDGGLLDPSAQVHSLLLKSKNAAAGDRGKMKADQVAVIWFRGFDIWMGEAPATKLRSPKYRSFPTIPGDVEWYAAGLS